MGKFDGVLFVSDYDDTLYNSALKVSKEDRDAIQYFIDRGGRFSIATGRAHRTFTPQIEKENLKFNAPIILSNGAEIYDYSREIYIIRTQLNERTPGRMIKLCKMFPELAFEAYYDDDIYVYNPNKVTMRHLNRVAVPYKLCPIQEMPSPWSKVIMEQSEGVLKQVQKYFYQNWGNEYDVIFSNSCLLELTDKGGNKGTMVERLAKELSILQDHIYCIGDNQNDIPMLERSMIPFAPENCAQQVKDWGARTLNHCDRHAVAQAIDILDKIY